MDLGEKIHIHRKAMRPKLTIEHMAKEIPLSKGYFHQIETGHCTNPSAWVVMRIAQILEVPMEYLLDDNVETVEPKNTDQVFLRKFNKLSPRWKIKVGQMIDIILKD